MRIARVLVSACLVALALTLSASCTTTYYDWGRYEDSVYQVTRQPDGFDLAAEIDSLEKQLEQSAAKERPVPPGLHAHLGYLHTVAGHADAASSHDRIALNNDLLDLPVEDLLTSLAAAKAPRSTSGDASSEASGKPPTTWTPERSSASARRRPGPETLPSIRSSG